MARDRSGRCLPSLDRRVGLNWPCGKVRDAKWPGGWYGPSDLDGLDGPDGVRVVAKRKKTKKSGKSGKSAKKGKPRVTGVRGGGARPPEPVPKNAWLLDLLPTPPALDYFGVYCLLIATDAHTGAIRALEPCPVSASDFDSRLERFLLRASSRPRPPCGPGRPEVLLVRPERLEELLPRLVVSGYDVRESAIHPAPKRLFRQLEANAKPFYPADIFGTRRRVAEMLALAGRLGGSPGWKKKKTEEMPRLILRLRDVESAPSGAPTIDFPFACLSRSVEGADMLVLCRTERDLRDLLYPGPGPKQGRPPSPPPPPRALAIWSDAGPVPHTVAEVYAHMGWSRRDCRPVVGSLRGHEPVDELLDAASTDCLLLAIEAIAGFLSRKDRPGPQLPLFEASCDAVTLASGRRILVETLAQPERHLPREESPPRGASALDGLKPLVPPCHHHLSRTLRARLHPGLPRHGSP